MNVVIKFTERQEELKALAILLRHSPGTMLPDRTYVVSEDAARALTEGGVTFTRIAGDFNPATLRTAARGQRI
jgi:hypothetical protein